MDTAEEAGDQGIWKKSSTLAFDFKQQQQDLLGILHICRQNIDLWFVTMQKWQRIAFGSLFRFFSIQNIIRADLEMRNDQHRKENKLMQKLAYGEQTACAKEDGGRNPQKGLMWTMWDRDKNRLQKLTKKNTKTTESETGQESFTWRESLFWLFSLAMFWNTQSLFKVFPFHFFLHQTLFFCFPLA